MADLQAVLAADVSAALTAEFGPDYADTDPLIRPSAFADFQSNAPLALAKRLGRQPRDVAAQIAAHLSQSPMVARAETSGPGFVNITLRDSWLSEAVAAQLADPNLGIERADTPRTIVVDYSGPNVAKELHAGHLRATGVGDAIVRVLEHLGNTVIRAAHLGDWGTQFGMLIEHAIEVGEQATYDQLAAGEFTDFYQAANEKFRTDPAFADRSRLRVVKLQAGEEQSLRLWQLLVTDSMEYLRKLYARLHITLTDADMDPESFYNPMLDDVCSELERMGIATISDGALCAFPPGFTGRDGRPLPLILRKTDGGYGYAATDVAAIRYRLLDLHADRIIYVVGSEQRQHLAMVMAVARQAGWLTEEVRAEHAVIGLMTGPGGHRLRTRSGGQFKLAELIDEAVERAEEVIKDRYDDPELRAQIAEDVGVGALKYGDLSVARSSSYVLDFNRLLALNGNTGPYLQYAAARIRSIFARAKLSPEMATGPIVLGEPAERALALRLLDFSAALAETAEDAEPHKLAGFLFDMASDFTTFYEQCPVLKAGSAEVKNSRLALCALTLKVLLTGLDLLGIPVPDRM
ncbi:MAG TPA: arginine--tRNA ligase [Streptosporangiaceae bacterium]|jgi:arginyl-tRNA synthetase|nr:arginine--tRNA ligase [Streptosporangiaceae bacterium]